MCVHVCPLSIVCVCPLSIIWVVSVRARVYVYACVSTVHCLRYVCTCPLSMVNVCVRTRVCVYACVHCPSFEWWISGVGSNRVGGPPIQIVGVALNFVTTIIIDYTFCKGNIRNLIQTCAKKVWFMMRIRRKGGPGPPFDWGGGAVAPLAPTPLWMCVCTRVYVCTHVSTVHCLRYVCVCVVHCFLPAVLSWGPSYQTCSHFILNRKGSLGQAHPLLLNLYIIVIV
jgi:hypothetical protein